MGSLKKIAHIVVPVTPLAVAGYGFYSGVDWAIVVGMIAMILMPPEWDLAIRIKERQIKSGEHPEA